MAPDLKALGIDKMSEADRLSLMHAIGKTLQPATLTDAQKEELDRRLDEIDAGTARMIPYEEVKARIRARFGK